MKTRVVTVSALLRDGTYRSSLVPFIRLAGRRVEEAGFEPGDSIQVEVEYGRLVITELSPDGKTVEPGHDPTQFFFMKEMADQTRKKRGRYDGEGEP